ncbi:DMT family transporter [Pelagimonas sp. KU-00592-HH]|uniref:DMT family transporter n=1 Tax=Pelagimonas sp. KU-00592-HH TaxID=3127651 RepID=UPI00310C68B1
MERKTHIDTFGTIALTVFAIALSFNQVVIKVTNGGFSPVFSAGIRSLIGLTAVALWMAYRRKAFGRSAPVVRAGILAGILFSLEFICLYIALDLTTVSRASIIFYSMPVWLALVAHVFLPGERLNAVRLLGLVLAMAGVIVAVMDRQGGEASLWGDLFALGAAIFWGGIALVVRLTPLSQEKPETQLIWQLIVSSIVLIAVAPLFGPLLRDPQAIHVAGLMFQAIGIVAIAYLIWFWLLTIYPASGVASFSFLSPVFSVLLGWWLLDEQVGLSIWLALVLVALGIILINRR